MTQGGVEMKCYKLKCTVESTSFTEESYGVLIVKDDNSREYFCNISNDSDIVAKLVNELNGNHIDSCHINSVIEDFRYNMTNS